MAEKDFHISEKYNFRHALRRPCVGWRRPGKVRILVRGFPREREINFIPENWQQRQQGVLNRLALDAAAGVYKYKKRIRPVVGVIGA